jgi:hypothetical protein
VSTTDLASWLRDTMPVILVLYDAVGDRAFWLYVQRYAEENMLNPDDLGGSVTVRIATTDVLDYHGLSRIRDFKHRIKGQAEKAIRHADD